MKKIGLLLALLCAIGGGIWFFARTTTLTVQPVLIAGGLDVSSVIPIEVGVLKDGAKPDAFRFTDIEVLSPVEGYENTFHVPAGQTIGLIAYGRGIGVVNDTVVLDRGADETIALVLDAAQVELTVTSDPQGGQTRVKHVETAEGIGPEVDENGKAMFFVPAGPQTFEVSQEFVVLKEAIDAVAGETYALQLDTRVGALTLGLDTQTQWSSDMPAVDFKITDKAGLPWQARSGNEPQVSFRDLPFGEYTAEVEFLAGNGPRILRPNPVGPFSLRVDDFETEVMLTVPLVTVVADLSAWSVADRAGADVMIRSMNDVGLALAAAKVGDEPSMLVFLSADEATEYAIVVARGNDVLAVAPIGPLAANTTQTVTVAQGGDAALCAAVTEVANCDRLTP